MSWLELYGSASSAYKAHQRSSSAIFAGDCDGALATELRRPSLMALLEVLSVELDTQDAAAGTLLDVRVTH